MELTWGMDQIEPDERTRPPEEWREAFFFEDAIDNASVGQGTMLADPAIHKT